MWIEGQFNLDWDPIRQSWQERIMRSLINNLRLGKLADGLNHDALRIVEPLFDKMFDRIFTVFGAQLF